MLVKMLTGKLKVKGTKKMKELYLILMIISICINAAVHLTEGFSEKTKNIWFAIAIGMGLGSFFAYSW